MKFSKISLIAILLWLITVAVAAWFFVRGNTAQGTDGRTAIVLQANERDLVLAEMRGLLLATHDILDGLNKGDMKQVAQAARSGGMGAAADLDPGLMAKLPISFKQLGMSVHHSMDDIAKAVENGKQAAEISAMLTATLSNCIACHGSWQLQTASQAH